MNTNNLTKPSMLMLLGGNALSIIGCLLPFVTVFGYSTSYIEGDGVFVLVLCVVSIALAFFKPKFAFIANAIALLMTLIGIAQVAKLSLNLLGIGAYVIIAANIVAIIGSIKSKNE